MIFDDTAFFSVWYWLLTAVFWSLASHFTHGVPYDVLRRAQRHGGEDAEIADRLMRRMIQLIDEGAARWGLAGAALAGFLLAALAVAGGLGGSELATGLFLLLAPAAGIFALQLAEARRIAPHLHEIPHEDLLAGFLRRRFANQVGGMFAVFLAVALLTWMNRDHILLHAY